VQPMRYILVDLLQKYPQGVVLGLGLCVENPALRTLWFKGEEGEGQKRYHISCPIPMLGRDGYSTQSSADIARKEQQNERSRPFFN